MPKKIALIVDDDDTLKALTARQLAKLGIDAIFASNGKEALSFIESAEQDFDLILMDVQMPEMDGLEATVLIREREARLGKNRVPIIAMTASREKDAALQAGMDDFLFKPVLFKALQQVVEQWLKERS